MKRLLIISPYFVPVNTADMQRVRMSLPYFHRFGWDAEVVCVESEYTDLSPDPLLEHALPKGVKIHRVKALNKQLTKKFGLGNIALRSLWYYRNYVDKLLLTERFDLIYFSTTQFPVCILGPYWKRKYKIPYVIDMQDPWSNDYYDNKPRQQRPPKYWFSKRLNRLLEKLAMRSVDGLIAVAGQYLDDLRRKYIYLNEIPAAVITFGAFSRDIIIAKKFREQLSKAYDDDDRYRHIVYIGRGGQDMQRPADLLFRSFARLLTIAPERFGFFRFHFIGTSYAPAGQGKPTIYPVALENGVADHVTERTDRVGLYVNIHSLLSADALLILGSDDPNYTASKIYPYITAEKPLLAIFGAGSSAGQIIRQTNAGSVADLDDERGAAIIIEDFLTGLDRPYKNATDKAAFAAYSAERMTERQCDLFNKVINGQHT